jgi:copper homeostasis protein
MSSVTGQRAILEVLVLHPRDAAAATEGGADRLLFLADPDGVGSSPEPAQLSAVLRETDRPVRVMLRLGEGYDVTGGSFARLVGLASDFRQLGAHSFSFGFLDADLEIDVETCQMLLDRLTGVPWTFHRAIDSTLEPRRSWRRLAPLPRLVAVRSAGSPRGMEVGFDDLLATITPEIAPLVMPGGGLAAEHVPWLLKKGVRQLHLGSQARPGGSAKAYVDAGYVRSWRSMVDDVRA